jgi:HEAT repeat protein
MPPTFRSKAIQGLFAATLGLCSNFSNADPGFSEIPDQVVEDLIDEVERAELDGASGHEILERLSLDSRISVRARVAEAAGQMWRKDPEQGLCILRQLAGDEIGEVRVAAARGLAHFLERAPSLLRASTESQWTLSRVARERVALALALGISPTDWLTDLALEELAGDAQPRVRWAALRAAESHLDENPTAYVRLGLGHVGDRDRRVRQTARRLLRRAEASGWLASGDSPRRAEKRALRRRARDAARRLT